MRSLDEVLDHLAFHPATPEAAAKYDQIRNLYIGLAKDLWPLLPDGANKTVAMRALHDAEQKAISAVAIDETPADWDHPHVARVLPT